MNAGLFPGTFDPPTVGHVSTAARAVSLFSVLYVGVGTNGSKETLFSQKERCTMMEWALETLPKNVRDKIHLCSMGEELTVRFAKRLRVTHLVRGVRATGDFEYEFQWAGANRMLDPKLDVVFFPTQDTRFISSSLIKDLAFHGGDISSFVPPKVREFVMQRISRHRERRNALDGEA